MNRFFIASGSALAALGVILGAFGAHALKSRLDAGQLQVFETGVKYQMYHALALILLGILFEKFNTSTMIWSGYFFLAGIIFFCGSLYLLSTKSILGIESWKFLGPITPLGGLCFIAGWVLLLLSVLKNKTI
jgi:uncharacterized membrane protein YgdD (TMEM256/DUF423 family)